MGSYYAGIMNSKYSRELQHHGIVGQKWGVRRFQNADGTLTPAGKERYYNSISEKDRKNFLKENYGYLEGDRIASWATSFALDNYISRKGKIPDWDDIDNALTEIDDESSKLKSRKEKTEKYRDKIIQLSYKMDDEKDGYKFDSKNVPKDWNSHIHDVAKQINDNCGDTEAWNKKNALYNEYKHIVNPFKKKQAYQKYLDAQKKYDRLSEYGEILFLEQIKKEIEKLPKNQQNQAMYLIAATFYD